MTKQGAKPYSPKVAKRRRKVLQLVEQGCKLREITKQTGISPATIRSDLIALNIPPAAISSKKAEIQERHARASQLHSEGKSASEIGKAMGVSYGQVMYALEQQPEEAPTTNPTETNNIGDASSFRDEALRFTIFGFSIEEIATSLSLTLHQAHSLQESTLRELKLDPYLIAPYLQELVEQNYTIHQVAASTNMGQNVIRQIAKKQGINEQWCVSDQRVERIEQTVEMFHRGVTPAEISRTFGITREMTRRDLVAGGVDQESYRRKQRNEMAQTVAELISVGNSTRETAEQAGISVKRVKTLIAEYDIPRPAYKKDTHGTVQCYAYGCRRPECKAANAERARKTREGRKNRPVPEHVHGTNNGYANWGCHCTECSEAHRIACNKARQKRKERRS